MAGRIPNAFIQDLIQRTDIVQLIGERLDLKKAGREYRARSPFTNEKTPSFYVNPTKQMFFDFSSGKNGTAISFLMEYDRLSFVEAVEELARRAGVPVPREGGSDAPAVVLDGPLDALAAAERLWKAELRKSDVAIQYLKKRGITGETAKAFGIGFAPESWDFLAKQFPDATHAITAGLLVKKDSGGVYDRFRNRVMFPIRDTRGRVIAFGGRTLGNDPAKYLNSPETPLFHKGRNLYGLYEARQSGDLPYVLVVEGYMDCVMLHQHGLRNAVATLGTATTREHLTLLFKSTPRVVFCFDGDRAGRSAAWRALEQALPEMHEGRDCGFMFLPEGHDPDTLVQEIGAGEFRRRAATAMPVLDYIVAELEKGVDFGSMTGRARFVGLARPFLQKLREGPLRAAFTERLWQLSQMNKDDFHATLARDLAAAPDPGLVDAPVTAAARPVQNALRLLLAQPGLAAIADRDALLALEEPGMDLLRHALGFFAGQPRATAGQWLEQWRETPEWEAVNQLAAARVEATGEAVEREFQDAISHLSRRGLRARAQALVQEARRRELSPEEQKELDSLSRQLAGAPSV